MVLWELFLVFFRVGLFAIGGAYSFLPLLEKEVVEKYHWLTKDEFLDVLGMVKIFPGAISVKYATYAGYKIKGISGAVIANLGNLLAPAVLVILASAFYAKYKNLPTFQNIFNKVQLVIFSMIIAVAFQLIQVSELTQFKSLLVIIASFILFVYFRVHPALIIIIAGLLGALKF